MSEVPVAAPSQDSTPRGRPGYRGRSRRGHHHGPRRPGDASGERRQPAQPESALAPPGPVAVATEESGIDGRARGGQPTRGRGDRARHGGGRRGRGGSGQRSVVVSHRGGRGPPPIPGGTGASAAAPGLRAAAPEFIPGQPLPSFRVEPQDVTQSQSQSSSTAPRGMSKSTAADMPTRIHEDIENHQYECVICTNEVLRSSKVWSCSICWTVTHLHCVRKWYTNQMKEREENPGPNQPEGWRCPGCNSTVVEQPGLYRCWCGKDVDPKSIPGLPPHTCGQTCSKPRETCPHQCPLMCHAGPCPPCTLMGPTQPCFCGKNTSTKRCTETNYGKGWSCQEPCGDLLPCGEHRCPQPCHPGLCQVCDIPTLSTCYCGKEQREIPCSQREDVLESFNYGQLKFPSTVGNTNPDRIEVFEGSFRCGNICGRAYDCGYHACQEPCHPQAQAPAHCPFSPDVVTHCPCGKTPLGTMPVQPRSSCQDPVPRCDEPCNKILACGHLCLDRCHTGPCAPCSQYLDITCRCGRTTVKSACHQGRIEQPVCFRVCKAQLNCGRHECGERCCPGEKKAAERRKQKRNGVDHYEPEHICLQVCGRQLKCGRHTCQQLCHKGTCMSCPEAIFDEISCSCGRTVLQPPQPCGTRPPECRFPCTKVRPCGHPPLHHQCHPDETPCPKCPFLMEKPCICGKKTLKNQPCWFDEGRCGLPCGKLLKCGAHTCRKPCHKGGECEDAAISGSHCGQPCGRTRKSCEHACVDPCHAPFPCKEDTPCQSRTFITCPCQHLKQEVRCLATKLNPWPTRELSLKCDDECLRLQRNRKLAEALNIDPQTHIDDHIPYSDTTLKLFSENMAWAQAQEREFRVFAAAPEEKRLRFKPMQSHQRAFLHALAEDFGFDSESQDPEPHRHVCVFKTPRFVSAPSKTLAQCVRIAKAAATLGTGASLLRPAASAPGQQHQKHQAEAFNALLLKDPRFGLTIDELEPALDTDLAAASRSGPALTFATTFLPSDEVLIKAVPNLTAAAIATSLAPTPQAVESTLFNLKVAVSRTVSRLGLAGAVSLCHVDSTCTTPKITRREGDAAANDGGWSAVASRGSWRKAARQAAAGSVPAASEQRRAPSAFVALRKPEAGKKKATVGEAVSKTVSEVEGNVEDDWLVAAEKEEAAATAAQPNGDGKTEEDLAEAAETGKTTEDSKNGEGGKAVIEAESSDVGGAVEDEKSGERQMGADTCASPPVVSSATS